MVREDIYHELHAFLVRELLEGEGAELSGGTPLLETGILDSMSLVSLIAFIETELGVMIPNTEVKPQHFVTLDAIVELVARTLAATPT
jgi:acyl carrier protein